MNYYSTLTWKEKQKPLLGNIKWCLSALKCYYLIQVNISTIGYNMMNDADMFPRTDFKLEHWYFSLGKNYIAFPKFQVLVFICISALD